MQRQSSGSHVPYNPTIDYLRFISILIIVHFHAVSPNGWLAQGAVGYFEIALVWFFLSGLERRRQPALRAIADKTRRLMYPFLVWSALQILAKYLQSVITGGDFIADLLSWLPPRGTFAQLWFLPWAWFVIIILLILSSYLNFRIKSNKFLFIYLIIFLAISTYILKLSHNINIAQIFYNCLIYSISIMSGILIYCIRDNVSKMVLVSVVIAAYGVVLQWLGLTSSQFWVPLLIVGALLVPLPEFRWTRRLGQMSMDIYLVHILVLGAIGSVLGIPTNTTPGVLLAFVFSIAAAAVMQIPAVGKFVH